MKKKLLLILLITFGYFSHAQLTCPTLSSPTDGSINIPVDTMIEWDGIEGAPGYLISIGTTPNGTDIINNQNVGNATSYQPPLGLPDNQDIYVTITIFFFNAENIVCASESFRTIDVTEPPTCTTPTFPVANATNVNIGTRISWNYAPTATGYRISLGTTLGGTDLVNNQNIIGTPSFQPPTDLPVDAEIFVTVVPYNENGPSLSPCTSYSFTTGAIAIIPTCTSLVSPVDGEINVALSPILEWSAVPNADGYRVTIGTTPFNANVIDNTTFTSNSSLFIEFEPNLTFFITIIPFNAAGDAIGCSQESFSTILGCGPYFNTITGEFVDLAPEISIPDTVSICKNGSPFSFTTEDTAEGFRWFQIDENETETLISMDATVIFSEPGRYRYEAFNTVSQSGTTIECSSSKIFNVVASEIANNLTLNVISQNGNLEIELQHDGAGDYEYAIDDNTSNYQESPIFKNVELGNHIFFVNDKNGCGIAEIRFEQDLTVEGFPTFFTPNGDGINDFWQILPSVSGDNIEVSTIEVFDRYGNLLIQLDPKSKGWDGTFNGNDLPASDYWFKANAINQKLIYGHFTLKR